MTGFEIGLVGALQIAGTVIGAVGSIMQGVSASRAADYNAAVGKQNALQSRQAAAESAQRQRRISAKRQGTLRAGGASMDLLEDSAMQEELEALTIIHGGEIRAIGFERSAALDRARGSTALTSGFVGAAGTLLTGGVDIATSSPDLFKSTKAPVKLNSSPGVALGALA